MKYNVLSLKSKNSVPYFRTNPVSSSKYHDQFVTDVSKLWDETHSLLTMLPDQG